MLRWRAYRLSSHSRMAYRTHQGRVDLETGRCLQLRRPPRSFFLTAGQVSDDTGAAALLSSLPPAKALLADRGYDADWLRDALADRKIEACNPAKSNRKNRIPHDRLLYKKRHKIENMFGKLKDWRRIRTRYDRCAHSFMSAIAIAAIVIFWI